MARAKKPAPKDGPNKMRPDVAETAFRVMQEAIGEKPKTVPGAGPKNPTAAERGSKGGKKGGTSRAAKLSGRQRAEIAHVASTARWKKSKD